MYSVDSSRSPKTMHVCVCVCVFVKEREGERKQDSDSCNVTVSLSLSSLRHLSSTFDLFVVQEELSACSPYQEVFSTMLLVESHSDFAVENMSRNDQDDDEGLVLIILLSSLLLFLLNDDNDRVDPDNERTGPVISDVLEVYLSTCSVVILPS